MAKVKKQSPISFATSEMQQLNNKLEQIVVKECEINFFSATKMLTREVKHSAFLSWLMSPDKAHKLNNAVLEKFVKILWGLPKISNATSSNEEILKSQFKDENDFLKCINCEEINVDVEVKTDKGKYIDILIYIPDSKTVITIENKVFTETHDNQLKNYQEYIDKQTYIKGDKFFDFSNYTHKVFVLLSPDYQIPLSNDKPQVYMDRWCVLSYNEIITIINEILSEINSKQFKKLEKSKTDKNKLKEYLKEYIKMVNTEILKNKLDLLAKNEQLREDCEKLILSDKRDMLETVLTYYQNYARIENVLNYCKDYLLSKDKNLKIEWRKQKNKQKTSLWVYTDSILKFIDNNNQTQPEWTCAIVPTEKGKVDAIIELVRKGKGSFNQKQLEYKNIYPKKSTGSTNYRIFTQNISSIEERGRLLEDIKQDLNIRLDNFYIKLQDFEKELLSL